MADSPVSNATKLSSGDFTKHQFGVALEPQVVTMCCIAVMVGIIGGLVGQDLLELIYFLPT